VSFTHVAVPVLWNITVPSVIRNAELRLALVELAVGCQVGGALTVSEMLALADKMPLVPLTVSM
jgi:hypothetical protein